MQSWLLLASRPPVPSAVPSTLRTAGTQDAFQLLSASSPVISPDSRKTNDYIQTSENLSLQSTLFHSVDKEEKRRGSYRRKEWLILVLLNLNNKRNSRVCLFFKNFLFYFLGAPCNMWELSSPSRNQFCVSCIGSAECLTTGAPGES